MTEAASPPLVAVDVDLRDFQFMPLDVVRLRDSDLASRVTGEEFRAAVLLWCAAWHQKPAASLPDDDVILSSLAGFGRVVREWQGVRAGALRGWIKCSDGRLYHPVVAEKANEAWLQKQIFAWRRECDRIRKENVARAKSGKAALGFPTKPGLCETENEIIPAECEDASDGIPAENALKGQGQGQGTDQRINPSPPDGGAGGNGLFAKFWKAFPKGGNPPEDATRTEFAKLDEGTQRQLAERAGAIAAAVKAENNTRPYNPAKFLADGRYRSILARGAPSNVRVICRDSDEGRARDAESVRIKGVPAFWLDDGTFHATGPPANVVAIRSG